jgi:hypothetical protein
MYKKNRYITDFLYSTPNFLSGAGTVINLGGDYYRFNESSSPIEADSRAIRNDFNMIGQDISDVIEEMKLNDKNLIFTK